MAMIQNPTVSFFVTVYCTLSFAVCIASGTRLAKNRLINSRAGEVHVRLQSIEILVQAPPS